jgi:hypothetical protein
MERPDVTKANPEHPVAGLLFVETIGIDFSLWYRFNLW